MKIAAQKEITVHSTSDKGRRRQAAELLLQSFKFNYQGNAIKCIALSADKDLALISVANVKFC